MSRWNTWSGHFPRRTFPKGVLPGPKPCPMCGRGPYLRASGMRVHFLRDHPEIKAHDRSLWLDKVRWPGAA